MQLLQRAQRLCHGRHCAARLFGWVPQAFLFALAHILSKRKGKCQKGVQCSSSCSRRGAGGGAEHKQARKGVLLHVVQRLASTAIWQGVRRMQECKGYT